MIGFSRSRLSGRRPSQLRAVRTYLLSILILTLLFFSVSLISLVRQQETVRELSSSNLRPDGERIALELEREVDSEAESCLGSEQLKSIRISPRKELSLQEARALRTAFDRVREDHPIARHFFVLDDNKVVFPRLSPPAPDTPRSMISSDQTQAARQFESLMRNAYDEESAPAGYAGNALSLYDQAEALDVPDRLKALAAFRSARTHQRVNGTAASVAAYRRLLKLYGDQYDEYQTPYSLALALAPRELAARIFPSYAQTLRNVRQSLIDGQWELSADQVDRYLTQFEQRLGPEGEPNRSSEFLDQFAMAKAASLEFQDKRASLDSQVNTRALKTGEKIYQSYYTLLSREGDREIIVGFSVSAPYLQEAVLPRFIASILGNTAIAASIEETSEGPNAEAEKSALHIPFGDFALLMAAEHPFGEDSDKHESGTP